MAIGSQHPLRAWALRGILAVLLAGVAVHFAHTLFGLGSPEHDFLIQEWIFDVVTMGAALSVIACAALRRDDRIAWTLIGAGLLAWAVADLYWSLDYAELDTPPFPGPADAGYLLGYGLIIPGVAALVRGRIRQMSAVVWADVAIAALCIAAIGTTVLMDYVVENTTGTTAEVIIALAYPLLDLIALTVAIAALSVTGWRPGRALALVAAGIAFTAVGDAVFTYQSLAGTYEGGAWNNSLWPLGVASIAIAAMQPPAERRTIPRPESWRSFASPAIFALAVVALLVLGGTGGEHAELTAALRTATLTAIVARLGLTFRENRLLVRALQRDALTHLGNRSKLFIDLDRALGQGSISPHTLLFCDLDGFKAYNDSFGHPAGDALLRRLASRLAAAVDGRARAYRLSGDEFAILAAREVADNRDLIDDVIDSLSEHGQGFEIGCAHGATSLPLEATTPEQALQLADQRMYEDKDSRRPSPGAEVAAVLARILQQRSPELGTHGASVSSVAVAVGGGLGIRGAECEALRRAAEFHDIGKVAIPDAILDKPGPLNEQEWEFMSQHTITGQRILSAAPSLSAVGAIVRSTHERWDGGGYPDGLAGEEIPLAARIIFVCDAYDAMTQDRVYASSRSHAEALAELRREAGSKFDPEVVEALIAVVDSRAGDGADAATLSDAAVCVET